MPSTRTAAVLVLLVGCTLLAGCRRVECILDIQCPGSQHCGEDRRCHRRETPPPPPDEEFEGCIRFRDCGRAGEWVCLDGLCIRICDDDSVCRTGSHCAGGYCVSGFCLGDSDCAGGQCVDGRCASAVLEGQVSFCEVTPSHLVLAPGSVRTVHVTSYDEAGTPLAYRRSLAWAVDQEIGRVEGDSVSVEVVGEAPGEGLLSATIGETECTPAQVLVTASPSEDELRIAVVEDGSERPLRGVQVVGEGSVTTDVRGLATIPRPVEPVTVFAENREFVTLVPSESREIFVRMPFTEAFDLASMTLSPRNFDSLPTFGNTVHVALAGADLGRDPLRVTPRDLLGVPVEGVVDLGGTLFEGLLSGILGVSDQMFLDTMTFGVPRRPHRLWSIGGKAGISEWLTRAAPALVAEDQPAVVSHLFFAGLNVLSGASSSVPGTSSVAPFPRAPREVMLTWQDLPDLPEGFDGMFFATGVLAPEGLVPSGVATRDFRYLPEEEALESLSMWLGHTPVLPGEAKHYALVYAQPGPRLESYDREADGTPLVRSAIVHPLGPLAREMTETITTPFLPIPEEPLLIGRELHFPVPDPRVDFFRVDIASPDGPGWTVYAPASTTSLTLPPVPDGFLDPLAGAFEVILHTVSLRGGHSYDDWISLGGVDRSDLYAVVEAFATRRLERR